MPTIDPAGGGNNAATVTPNDSTDIQPPGYLNVSTSGTVRVTPISMADGSSVDVFIAAGTIFPLLVKRVWSTGTSAGTIVSVNR